MSGARAALLLAAALLLDALRPWPGAHAPDLPLLAVVVVATRRPPDQALVLAAAAGLVVDALSAAPFGLTALVFALVAHLVARLSARFFAGALLVRLLLLAAALLLPELARPALATLAGGGAPAAAGELLPRALLTLGAGAVLWRHPPRTAERRAW